MGVIIFVASVVAPKTAYASFENVLERMYDNELTKYASVQAYRPYDNITRWEAAKLISQYAVVQELSLVGDVDCGFNDTAWYDQTLSSFIYQVCVYGLMRWFQGNFRPYDNLSYAEWITIVMRSLLGRHDESSSPRWEYYAQSSDFLGIADEQDIRNYADEPVTRDVMGTWLYNAAAYSPEEAEQKIVESIKQTLTDGI